LAKCWQVLQPARHIPIPIAKCPASTGSDIGCSDSSSPSHPTSSRTSRRPVSDMSRHRERGRQPFTAGRCR
jgi:hypothetical protein